MNKIDEIISYMGKTSLYEKQKLIDTLLKSDFRLENDAKKFYEKELKADRAKMKELLLKEVEFEYEGKILILEREKGVLEQRIDDINEMYNAQLQNAKAILDEKLQELDKEILKLKTDKINEIRELEKRHKKSISDSNERFFSARKKIIELENKIKSYQIAYPLENVFFLNKQYRLLTDAELKIILNKLKELENKIYTAFPYSRFDTLDFKNKMFSYISSSYKLKLMTESVYQSIFDYFKSLEVTFSDSNNGEIIQVRVYDLLKEEIYNAETLYTAIFE